MTMRDYLDKHKKNQPHLRALAADVGCSRVYLTQIASGAGRASAKLARRIHEATGGEVHVSDLRPDIFPPGEAAGVPSMSASDSIDRR